MDRSDKSESAMADNLPGDGFLGWLGRQIGYVKQAVRTDPQPPANVAPTTAATNEAASDAAPSKVIFREDRVEETRHPDNPDLRLRRTVIDEVIQESADSGQSRP